MDVTRRPSDTWIIDFGVNTAEADAALYEAPFEYVRHHVKPERDNNRREVRKLYWWRHGETVPALRKCLTSVSRYIASPRVAKHRLFAWQDSSVLPDCQLVVIVRDNDTTFGILQSRFHELWSLRMGTSLEDRPRYTPKTTFDTFPFPEGLTPNITAADYADDPRAQSIAEAGRRLVELRDAWLNPPELVMREPEVVPGYPDRILPVDAHAASELKKRTLTNLYNARPAWLADAHRALDEAVAAAYGWKADIDEGEVLRRLLELNHKRTEVN
jgi:type II restriction/modification system DNA methylase subunit YeeA